MHNSGVGLCPSQRELEALKQQTVFFFRFANFQTSLSYLVLYFQPEVQRRSHIIEGFVHQWYECFTDVQQQSEVFAKQLLNMFLGIGLLTILTKYLKERATVSLFFKLCTFPIFTGYGQILHSLIKQFSNYGTRAYGEINRMLGK